MTSASDRFAKGLAALNMSRHADCGSEFRSDLEEAIAAFNEALALEPRHVEALRERGFAFGLLGQHPEALDSFVAAASLAPADAGVRLAVAQSQLALGQDEAALASFEEVLRLRPGDDEALFRRAAVLTRSRRDELALSAWDDVLATADTRNLDLHGRTARVLTEDVRRLQARLSRALVLGRLGRPETTRVFREVFDEHPVEVASSFVASVLHEALQTLEPARAAYREHCEAHADEPHVWGRAGNVWIAAHLPDEAIRAWDRAVAKGPTARTWYGKAEAHAQAGQLDAAIAAYRRSLELEPGFLGAQARLEVALRSKQSA